jgi:hypothetical protein
MQMNTWKLVSTWSLSWAEKFVLTNDNFSHSNSWKVYSIEMEKILFRWKCPWFTSNFCLEFSKKVSKELVIFKQKNQIISGRFHQNDKLVFKQFFIQIPSLFMLGIHYMWMHFLNESLLNNDSLDSDKLDFKFHGWWILTTLLVWKAL